MRAAAALSGCAMSTPYRLTGQSLLRAERNLNECNWSRARKKIGPVNQPCDRPIDVISIASLIFLVTSRLADQRKKKHSGSRQGGQLSQPALPADATISFRPPAGLVSPAISSRRPYRKRVSPPLA